MSVVYSQFLLQLIWRSNIRNSHRIFIGSNLLTPTHLTTPAKIGPLAYHFPAPIWESRCPCCRHSSLGMRPSIGLATAQLQNPQILSFVLKTLATARHSRFFLDHIVIQRRSLAWTLVNRDPMASESTGQTPALLKITQGLNFFVTPLITVFTRLSPAPDWAPHLR